MDEETIRNILLKYKDELDNYIYVPEDKLHEIPLKSRIKYISKGSLVPKNGMLRRVDENIILELYMGKRKWYIYQNKYYIFYKKQGSKLKLLLQKMVNNDFNKLKLY